MESESSPVRALGAVPSTPLRRTLPWRLFASDLARGLTWTRVGWTFALAATLALYSTPSDVLDKAGRFDAPVAFYIQGFLLFWLQTYLLPLVGLMLLATVADNLPLRGRPRALGFGAALILGYLANASPAQIRIGASCARERLEIRVVCGGMPAGWVFAPAVANEIRDRLRTLFGNDAGLQIATAREETTAILSMSQPRPGTTEAPGRMPADAAESPQTDPAYQGA